MGVIPVGGARVGLSRCLPLHLALRLLGQVLALTLLTLTLACLVVPAAAHATDGETLPKLAVLSGEKITFRVEATA